MSTEEDQNLIQKVSMGDTKAFEKLIIKYGDLIFGLSLKLLKDQPKAEDMTQETWIKVAKNANKYSPIGSVKSWILQINRNLIMDYFREQKKWSDQIDVYDSDIVDENSNFDLKIQSEEKMNQFKSAFELLEDRERLVLTMVLVEELSYADISKNTGLTVGAIKTIVFRAKQKLKETINI